MDLSVRVLTNLLNNLVLLKYVNIGLIVHRIKGTGIILPKNASSVAWKGLMPKAIPTGMAPLTSITGSMAVSITVNSSVINFNKLPIISVIPNHSLIINHYLMVTKGIGYFKLDNKIKKVENP